MIQPDSIGRARTYADMRGVPTEIVTHSIPMRADARRIQRPHPVNPNYTQQVKAEIDKMLDGGIIHPIECLPDSSHPEEERQNLHMR